MGWSVPGKIKKKNLTITTMKKLIVPIILGLLVIGFPLTGFAQVTATATAELVEALSASEEDQLNFGKFIAGESGGSITVANTLAGAITTSGTVATIGGGAPSSASFDISGLASQTVEVTLPANGSVNLDHSTSSDVMNVASFTVSASTVTLSSTGDATVYVGATLTVPNSGIDVGVYSGTYQVTFAYQ